MDDSSITINLSEYQHELEIEARILIEQLSSFEIQLINTLFYSSLKTSVKELQNELNADIAQVEAALDALSPLRLFHLSNGDISINKETRKQLEPLIERLESDFSPTIQYLVDKLSCVPINLLPKWYALPHTSDQITQSIIDKYLSTPSKYTQQLSQLKNNNSQAQQVYDILYSSPQLRVSLRDVAQALSLSIRECHALILELEFHFACCLTYEVVSERLEPIVVPPTEWSCYLATQGETTSSSIQEDHVERIHRHDFGFINDMGKMLRTLLVEAITLDEEPFLPHNRTILDAIATSNEVATTYFQQLVAALEALNLASVKKGALTLTPEGKSWLSLTQEEQAMLLYFHHLKCYHHNSGIFSDRDVRKVEKALSTLPPNSWIPFETFCNSTIGAIGTTTPVTLRCIGRRWHYELPTYSDQERTFIQEVLTSHLYQCGMVATGWYNGKLHFKVTPFGQYSLAHE